MMSLLGIPIGFYGYLFPGNINIMTMELFKSKKYKVLLLVLLMTIVFECLYCTFSLYYLNQLKTNTKLFFIIELTSYLLVFTMGLWMILDNKKNKETSKKNTLYRGLLSIIIHPQQIPYWIIVGVYLSPAMNFGSIHNYWTFILCNAIGTLLVMIAYMTYGNRLMQYFKLRLNQLNTKIGIIYLLMAVFSLTKLFLKP